MDIASLLGVGLCFIFMILSIVFSAGITGVVYFLDAPSAMITFGGAFMAVLASRSMPSFINGIKSYTLIFKMPADDTKGTIKQIIDLSNTARKEGLLALEEAANSIEDPLLKKGLLLTADGTEPELVRAILEAEIDAVDARHKLNIKFFEDWASQGPSWGMIGTLIGLVNMLNNMSDASSLGPNMAVALITTFYGSAIANWICFPIAEKLKFDNDLELTFKGVMIEGILSIQAGENPRVTEEKLKAFMTPSEREAYDAANGGGGE